MGAVARAWTSIPPSSATMPRSPENQCDFRPVAKDQVDTGTWDTRNAGPQGQIPAAQPGQHVVSRGVVSYLVARESRRMTQGAQDAGKVAETMDGWGRCHQSLVGWWLRVWRRVFVGAARAARKGLGSSCTVMSTAAWSEPHSRIVPTLWPIRA